MISNSSPWDNLKFDPAGVQESARKMFSTLYNTYSFFALYANVDGFDASLPEVPLNERPEIDRWIISLLNTLVEKVITDLNDYEPTKAARAISDFVGDNLSNWYVRLNRKRFWGGEMTKDKLAAYQTLYQCLETIALLIAPISPFFADKLYQDLLTGMGKDAESVHLASFPTVKTEAIDHELEERMELAQTITSMVLALRRKVSIKVRQPLQTLIVPVVDEKQREMVEAIKNLVLTEVNVKTMKIVGSEEGALIKRVKPDFKKLGPKFGKQMKAVAATVAAMSQAQIAELERNKFVELELEGANARIDIEDVEIMSEDIPGWQVANEGSVTVALDTTITPELRQEGIARELVNRIQNIRKNSDFEITDRVNVVIDTDDKEIIDAITAYSDYIAGQVLASSLVTASLNSEAVNENMDIDGSEVKVSVTRN